MNKELHWKQRSRMTWLEAGDSNTKKFHSQAQQRKRANAIVGLLNNDDIWCTDEAQVEDIAVSYFEELFRSTQPVNPNDTLSAMESVVTMDANQNLLRPFLAEEVRAALFQMHPSKAPGPDGMSRFFLPKILAYSWQFCFPCCFINSQFRENPPQNKSDSYLLDTKEEKSGTDK
jgi:hypothetical protein